MNKETRNKIFFKIQEKLRNANGCPMCGERNLGIESTCSMVLFRESFKDQASWDREMPAVCTLCPNCGYISQFSLKTLGFTADTLE